uniref:Uncharacterized protein n=1 Tax=Kalanchoe fedtschenkoi TaxID=63787 RepID=A0A7N0T111_KALFE
MSTLGWCNILGQLKDYSIIPRVKLACITRSGCLLMRSLHRMVACRVHAMCVRLIYFVLVSWMGFWLLESLKSKEQPSTGSLSRPRKLDVLFTSVSATTVSSMSAVEMEVFSDSQLQVLTALMLVGSEVFVSMVGLFLRLPNSQTKPSRVSDHQLQEVELGIEPTTTSAEPEELRQLRYKCVRLLELLVLFYLVASHLIGVFSVWLYMSVNLTAKRVLDAKGLSLATFSVFTIVSTFSSCGFVPTNENMVIFRNNPGLQLILIPQALAGNTLFPSCMRLLVWLLGKCAKKKQEFKYLLKNTEEIGYMHLLPGLYSRLLALTVLGFICLQFVMLCAMEWSSGSLAGLRTGYERVVGVLFQSVNSRHTGETVADIATFSAANLVMFVVMMYLPPYTSFFPVERQEENKAIRSKEERNLRGIRNLNNFIFSPASYLVIFVILVCITERSQMKKDPINFSVVSPQSFLGTIRCN